MTKALLARLTTLVTGLVCGLLISRIILTDMGVESFALYSLLAALPALIPFADLGAGAVVVNAFAETRSPRSDTSLQRRLVTVVRVMGGFALIALALNVVLLVSGAWSALLGSAGEDARAPYAAFVCVLAFAVSMPLGIWTRVLLGLSRNHLVVLIQGLQAPLALALVFLIAHSPGDGAGVFVAAGYFIALVLVAIIGFRIADHQTHGLLQLTLRRSFSRRRARGARVMNVGWPMLAQTLTPPISTQLTRFVLAQVVTSTALAQYGLIVQLTLPAQSLVAAVGLTLWPYYSRARSRGETGISPYLLSALFGGAAVIGSALLVILAPPLIEFVVAGVVSVTAPVVAVFCVQIVASAILYPLGMYLMDAEGIRFQTIPAILMSLGSIAGVVMLAPSWGIVSVPASVAVSTVLFQIVPFAVYIRGRRRRRDLPA